MDYHSQILAAEQTVAEGRVMIQPNRIILRVSAPCGLAFSMQRIPKSANMVSITALPLLRVKSKELNT
jgi:C4-dicarboxylate transporter